MFDISIRANTGNHKNIESQINFVTFMFTILRFNCAQAFLHFISIKTREQWPGEYILYKSEIEHATYLGNLVIGVSDTVQASRTPVTCMVLHLKEPLH